MKRIITICATLYITSLSYAQNTSARVPLVGTFNYVIDRNSNEINKYKIKTSRGEIYRFIHPVKTSDGGSSTLVRFGENAKQAKDGYIKNIPSAEISIYPMPNNGDMTVSYSIPGSTVAEFSIYDLSGKRIKSIVLTGRRGKIALSGSELNPGVYLYNVISNGQIVKQDKIVIIR